MTQSTPQELRKQHLQNPHLARTAELTFGMNELVWGVFPQITETDKESD